MGPADGVLWCFQGMGKVKEALKDAEQCIMYNGSWDKGFTRKGAALRQSGDRTTTQRHWAPYIHSGTIAHAECRIGQADRRIRQADRRIRQADRRCALRYMPC